MSVIDDLAAKLTDPAVPLPARFRALFSLRGLAGAQARAALQDALKDPSALLRHEIAFCLGQMQDPEAVPVLIKLLEDKNEHPMVRHEAAEALGAIATPECLVPLEQHMEDEAQEVRETCTLALRRLEVAKKGKEGGSDTAAESTATEAVAAGGSAKEKLAAAAAADGGSAATGASAEASPYMSIDPAPAMGTDVSTAELRRLLLDENEDMFQRYAALFSLRNRGGEEEVEAVTASFKSSSALLKHEVAYVLGQMQKGAAVETLATILGDENENPMVRHEAAEALGSIANPRCLELLRQYLTHKESIVSESCQVALDILEYEQSGELHYADMSSSSATPVEAC